MQVHQLPASPMLHAPGPSFRATLLFAEARSQSRACPVIIGGPETLRPQQREPNSKNHSSNSSSRSHGIPILPSGLWPETATYQTVEDKPTKGSQVERRRDAVEAGKLLVKL